MASSLEELQKEYSEATNARILLEVERDAKRNTLVSEARARIDQQIKDEYGSKVAELLLVEVAARKAYETAKEEAGNEALTGYPSGVLMEWAAPRDRWSRKEIGPAKPTGRRGRYEVRTRQSDFASNAGYWRLPAIGEVFLRLLKKDGTPSTKFEEAQNWQTPTPFGDWRPDETEGAP